MSEEEKKAKKPAAKKEGAAAKKPAKKPAREAKKAEPPAPAPEEKAEEKPPVEQEEKAAAGEATAPEEERELTEEELRRLIEEEMEKITVKDILGSALMELIRQAYRRMGLPESVNLKYLDLEQASLAIDAIMGILAALDRKVPENEVAPYRSTLANLQMNYARLASQAKNT